jgi:radical SAM superfamily enzyme YgiQ (UPF0313 family)
MTEQNSSGVKKPPKVAFTLAPLVWPKLPPLGIGFLQSFLSQHDIPADILDINNYFYNMAALPLKTEWQKSCRIALEERIFSLIQEEFPGEWERVLDKLAQYDVVGFSCFKSNFITSLAVARLLKQQKPCVTIIFGGPEITRQYFQTNGSFTSPITELVNLIVVGEGELPVYRYLKSYMDNVNQASTKHHVSLFEELPNLDSLPFPRYTGLALTAYPRQQAMALQFSRGCIRRCQFCSERLLYKHFRSRPVNDVLAEIAYHKENNRIQHFIFFDSLVNAELDKLAEFCDGVIERFGSIPWEAQFAVRSDMDITLLAKMKQSGCYNLFIGLESGAEQTLKHMRKGYTAQQAVRVFKQLYEAGLNFGISLIVGYPGETEEDFNECLTFLTRHKEFIPKIEQINPFTYYEGTTADKEGDYRLQKISLLRMERLVETVKKEGYKYTKAFIGNLVEK